MKIVKIHIGLIMISTIILILSSCRGKDSINIYYFVHNNILYGYNININIITPVCNKQNCSHSTLECDFSGIWAVTKSLSAIYFIRDENIYINNCGSSVDQIIYEYVPDTNELNEICSIKSYNGTGINHKFEYKDGYIYYYKDIMNDNTTELVYSLQRVNVTTGNIDVLQTNNIIYSCFYDSELVYIDNGAMYITDIYGNNKRLIVNEDVKMANSDGSYLYYNKYNPNTNCFELYETDLSNHICVAEDFIESLYYNVCFRDIQIYYCIYKNGTYQLYYLDPGNGETCIYSTVNTIYNIDIYTNWILLFENTQGGINIETITI